MGAGSDVTELAQRTGLPADVLEHYAALDLLERDAAGRFASDSATRVRLIRFAESRGITPEALAIATAEQNILLGTFVELQTDPDRPYDMTKEAAKAGVDIDLLRQVQELMQWDDDSGSAEDVKALQMMGQALKAGLPREALMQLIRVYTDFADRLADAENRVFHHYVHDQFRTQGMTGPELLEATQAVSKPLLELVEPTVTYMHRWAFDRAAREDLLRHLTEGAVPSAPGQARATVMFVDLASFTPLTAAMGDESAADVLARFGTLVRRCAHEHNGRIVKQIGDAFMLTFTEPKDAVGFGRSIVAGSAAESQFPALHVGAHHGAVLFREGDYVGTTVNLAARIAASSASGQFLISSDTAELVRQMPDLQLHSLPPRQLKGVAEAVELVEVACEESGTETVTDPVCGMRLQAGDVHEEIEHDGRAVSFCSPKCRAAFEADPSRHLR